MVETREARGCGVDFAGWGTVGGTPSGVAVCVVGSVGGLYGFWVLE